MDKLMKLRQALATKIGELNTDEVVADGKRFTEIEAEISELEGQIQRMEAAQNRSASLARPISGQSAQEVTGELRFAAATIHSNLSQLGRKFILKEVREAIGFEFNEERHFNSLGEQMQAIARYYDSRGSDLDPRLVRAKDSDTMTRAPSGAGTIDPTGGGFLVQTDFANMVFTRAYVLGKIMQRLQRFPISTGANSLKLPAVDETSRATGSRYGGVQSYWLAEGAPVGASKPKFRMVEFDLKKLGSFFTVTDELLADTSLLGSIAEQAFTEEIIFMTEDAVFEGDGIGKPMGILSAPSTLQVAKQNGQAAGTVVKENIDNIYAQLWSRSRENAVWGINQLLWPQLLQLGQAVGTGGLPVFLPAGTISGKPYSTLYGIPVEEWEYCSAPGTPGDIGLYDFSQYGIADKGGVQAASSMHVRFNYDEMAFRFIFRVDGKPMWSAPLTPFKGSQKLSPSVTLAQR